MTATNPDVIKAQNMIGDAIKLLKDAFNDTNATLSEMQYISHLASLLNKTDFEKTITQ